MLATFLNALFVITKKNFGAPCRSLVSTYLNKMLRGSESPMVLQNFCRGIIAVMPKFVTADRDVSIQSLEHAGKLFCVGIVPQRLFMLNVAT